MYCPPKRKPFLARYLLRRMIQLLKASQPLATLLLMFDITCHHPNISRYLPLLMMKLETRSAIRPCRRHQRMLPVVLAEGRLTLDHGNWARQLERVGHQEFEKSG